MGCGCGGGRNKAHQGNKARVRQSAQGIRSANQRRNARSIQQQRQIKAQGGALSEKQLAARDRIKKLRQQVIRKKFNK